MLIEVTADGLLHPKGEIVDVKEGLARAYIEAGQAKESDTMAALKQAVAAQSQKNSDEIKRGFEALRGSRPAPNPPAHRGGVEFEGEVRGGEASGERDPYGRAGRGPTYGDVTRFMYWERAFRTGDDDRITEGMARYASDRIKAWKLERTKSVERSFEEGIARDGQESGASGMQSYGVLVRPEFVSDVFRIEAETDVMVGLKQIPVGNGVEVHYPALDQYSTTTPTRTSNVFGGVVLGRKPEDVARTATDAKMTEIEFKLTDLTALTKVSRDLLADAFIDINGYLQGLFKDAFGWRRDWDYINGTGVGEPMGILNAPSAIAGGGISGNAGRTTAGDIRYEDLAWMISKMWPACRRGAYWICNAQATRVLQAVQDTATTPRYVYQPNALVSQSMVPSIIGGPGDWAGVLEGFPVKLSEKVPALGTRGDLVLFSPTYYGEAVRQGVEVGISEHRYFDTDQVGIRWKMRNDGASMFKGSITGADGNTYSNIVILK